MKYILISIFSLTLASCSAFSLEKMGNEGQKCFTDGTCNDSFTCITGTCIDETSSSDGSQTDNEESDDENVPTRLDDDADNDEAGVAVTEACNLGETCWSVVPTQQTRCFNDTGVTTCDEITSEFYGQDALYADTSSRGFENIKIGEKYYLFDNKTEILWYKTASETTVSHSNAVSFCEILNNNEIAEKTNWRLPYLHEMVSIVSFDESTDPMVDGFYFSYIDKSKYWTLTKLGGENYYYVDFSGSSQFYVENGTTAENYAICVSSDHNYGEDRLFKRYKEIPYDSVVTVEDISTGLVWQKVNDYTIRVWKEALKYCQDLDFAGKKDWRLPNINELHSIATYGLYPELQTTFPDLGDDFFWSSTTNANIIGNAWVMEFKYGILKPELPKNKNENSIYTMCVRNKD